MSSRGEIILSNYFNETTESESNSRSSVDNASASLESDNNDRPQKKNLEKVVLSLMRGKPCTLKFHLAIYCLDVPSDIQKYWHSRLVEDNNNYTRNAQSNLTLSVQ
ncbi:8905_t:CDS:2, partial [Scutellospora calospora]